MKNWLDRTKNFWHQQAFWQKTVMIASVLGVLIFLWILLETIQAKNTGFEEQTLWTWMELLIVPLLIPIGVLWLTRRSEENERKVTAYKSQREDLQTYFDSMTELLLKYKLHSNDESREARSIARALTLIVTPGLDARQKGQVLLFVYDSGLINRPPVLNLAELNMENAWLFRADLSRSHLRELRLREAVLEQTNLYQTNLRDARLQGANLNGALLNQANLRGAFLNNASLNASILRDTDLRGADLTAADLTEADLTDADLRSVELKNAKFTNATLINTKFAGVNLSNQELIAQLHEARMMSNIQLPDGSCHNRPEP
ncbi:MAG: hypothetical protein CSA11_08445 [Chloroflexi bacterium]|nr:MAG: hypothetical protein CSA11_08445 [Chloroflexota bacterium]